MGTHACTHTHTHTVLRREGREPTTKGPQRARAQPEGLLAFLLQGEKEQGKKGREVSRFILTQAELTARDTEESPEKPSERRGNAQSLAPGILTSCVRCPCFLVQNPGLATKTKGPRRPGNFSHPFLPFQSGRPAGSGPPGPRDQLCYQGPLPQAVGND